MILLIRPSRSVSSRKFRVISASCASTSGKVIAGASAQTEASDSEPPAFSRKVCTVSHQPPASPALPNPQPAPVDSEKESELEMDHARRFGVSWVNYTSMTKKERIRSFDQGNFQAAQIARSDPEKYPGAMQEWAEIVIENRIAQGLNKHARAPRNSVYPTLPLFDQR